MKIYSKNFTTEQLNLDKLSKYKIKECHYYEIYSESGIFLVEKNKIFKLTESKFIKSKTFDDYIIDLNKYIKKEEYYLPFDHIKIPIYEFTYKLEENSNVLLVVKGVEIKNEININSNLDINFKIIDFCFIKSNIKPKKERNISEEINIEKLIEEINVFLFQLK